MKFRFALFCVAIVFLSASSAFARRVYVNNQAGSDLADGLAETREDGNVGRVRSLKRPLHIANFGDTIVIANTGVAYRGSLTLTGRKHSGFGSIPFRVIGNGATPTGLWSVPAACWKSHGENLWSFEPPFKGHYLLLRDGKAVENFGKTYDDGAYGLKAKQFAVRHGRVLVRVEKGEDPTLMDFAMPQAAVGISLYGVRNAVIEDLNVQHFRIDGVNAHDLNRNVLIRRVTSQQNARAGITVTGSSAVIIRGCNVKSNVEASLRISGRGEADVQDSELDVEPSLVR